MTSPTVEATCRFEQQLDDPDVCSILDAVEHDEHEHCAAIGARVIDAIVELDDALQQLAAERGRVSRRLTEEAGLSRGVHADHLFGIRSTDFGVTVFDLTNRPVLTLSETALARIHEGRAARLADQNEISAPDPDR